MPEKFPTSETAPDTEQEMHLWKEKLEVLLTEEAAALRERGIIVTKDCRIDPEPFRELHGAKSVENDRDYVNNLEEKFKKNEDAERQRMSGEIMEMAKQVFFNRYWFSDEAFTVRTSAYDDYRNGVDEVIFIHDTEQKTFVPIAAIDTTSDITRKQTDKEKEHRTRGVQVKYGLEVHAGEEDDSELIVSKTSYERLPFFVVTFSKELLQEILQAIVEGRMPHEAIEKLKKHVVTNLQTECEANVNDPKTSPALRRRYQKALALIKRLM